MLLTVELRQLLTVLSNCGIEVVLLTVELRQVFLTVELRRCF